MRFRSTLPVVLASLLCCAAAAFAGPARGVAPQAWSPAPRTLAPPVNDNCDGAILLPCGNIVISGNTDQATNDYSFVDTLGSCTGFASRGRDVVYKLNVGVGDSLWIDYTNRTDGSIYLVSNCANVDGTCLAGSDKSSDPNTTESLNYKFTTAGLYYLILDSYGLNSGGLWSASGQLVCGPTTPPSNDLADNATPLPCGAINLSGSMQYAHSDYQFSSPGASCTGQLEAGADVVYKMTITAGDSLHIQYTSSANGGVYIASSASDPDGTCIVGKDATGTGQAEVLDYKFTFSGIYYLVLDHRNAGEWGVWTATGSLVCANPPPLNDRCDTAPPVTCGSFNWTGNTAFATNDYFFGANPSCTGFPADGKDVVYRFDVQTGDTLDAHYLSNNTDGSMYLVWGCDNVSVSCVAGSDNTVTGEYEVLHYVFPVGGTYFLILDSVDPGSSSTWSAYGYLSGHGCVAGVGDGPETGAIALRAISPNPSSGRTNVSFELPARAATSLRVYDLQGRARRTLVDGVLEAGPHRVTWDGRDDAGQRVDAGVYFVRIASGGREAARRMIFVH